MLIIALEHLPVPSWVSLAMFIARIGNRNHESYESSRMVGLMPAALTAKNCEMRETWVVCAKRSGRRFIAANFLWRFGQGWLSWI